MGMVEAFWDLFDERGCYRAGAGTEEVVFITRDGRTYPGRLSFSAGQCVRLQMDGGADLSHADQSPLNEVWVVLTFADGGRVTIMIHRGRILRAPSPDEWAARQEFLRTFRVARNLFAHGTPSPPGTRGRGGSAVWLSPKSLAGFEPTYFPELEPARRQELVAAVREFRETAGRVSPGTPPTTDDYQSAGAAFERIQDRLGPYLPVWDEAERVEGVLRSVDFPPWVDSWDYELGEDHEGSAAVWVHVFADDAVPLKGLGGSMTDLSLKFRAAFRAAGVGRWPYLRVRSAREPKF